MSNVVISLALALAWVPLFVRFLRGWRNRKNPVSMAICAMISYLIYVNVVTALTLLGLGTWKTTQSLSVLLNAFVVVNFYMSFHWSNQRFPDARRGSYSVPPTNISKPRDG